MHRECLWFHDPGNGWFEFKFIGTMQNKFLRLDTLFHFFAYDAPKVGISNDANRFLIKLKLERENQYCVSRVTKM